ncbi:MAG: alanine racemase [Sulfobacillus benefaciens]|uniref:Alanine racemase n=1 Tax=Sulfobacillus benefaciens TaxID=453960 RepID=A0A2T2XJR5_9FIRM|nr:MAG: alanine racemase [Sulfobacillus benefaciens]
MFDTLDTPVLLINEDTVEDNLKRMASRALAHGVALRPHSKTHKSPQLAWRQLQWGANGIMVAKLGEAEVMLDAGLREQTIGYPLIGQLKEDRLVSLMHKGLKPRFSVDSVEGITLLQRAAMRTATVVPALIEVDTGMNRCGLGTIPQIIELAQVLRQTPGVKFAGITCFGGHVAKTRDKDAIVTRIREENGLLIQIVSELRAAGLDPEIISEGGTVAAAFLEELQIATEIRPGTYIYNDAATVASYAARWEDCALTVLTTVVSKPASNRIVVDAGSKTLSFDGPVGNGYGVVKGCPQWCLSRLSEEHGVLESQDPLPFHIGDRLEIVPNHVCTTVNLHDRAFLVRASVITGMLEVAARGLVQ